MTVEHWASRSSHADPFRWADLLGVCSGDLDGQSHCDRSRGDQLLRLHPVHAGKRLDKVVRYAPDGAIALVGFDEDLAILNLNNPALVRSRRNVADAVLRMARGLDLTQLRAGLSRWEGTDSAGRRPEYPGIAVALLRRHIRVLEARGRRLKAKPSP